MSQTILIADDERMLRRTLQRVLSRAGFSVLTAENGAEAVKLFSENREKIDLCILDMNMPTLNGTEALHQIRNIEERANIVLASGESEQAILEQCTDIMPNGIIEKPFSLDTLLRDVRSFLV